MNRLPRSPIDIAAFSLRSGLSNGGLSQRNEKSFMRNLMNHTGGWGVSWTGGWMWMWALIIVLVVLLLAAVINRRSRK